jgi:hypothetical protein
MKRRPTAVTVTFQNFDNLHDEGKEMIRSWCALAKERAERGDWFVAFCFLWMSFNGWISCITGGGTDRQMIDALCDDETLKGDFDDLMRRSTDFRNYLGTFSSKWPIKDGAQGNIRRRPEPQEWTVDRKPRWEQLLNAVYRVRCNLFHGNKGTYVERDKDLIEGAYKCLCSLAEESAILKPVFARSDNNSLSD